MQRDEELFLISFIIPQKGRLDLLEATLRSIAQLELNSSEDLVPAEVVLITQDDNPLDALNLVERLFEGVELIKYQCIVANTENTTISSLRNRAARASHGELLAFLDADISLSENWVISMVSELLDNQERALVSAAQTLSLTPTAIEHIQVEINHIRVDSEVSALSGHNLLLRRETFEAVGGFPEHLKTCEDSVFTDKVSQIGALYRSSQASYVHLGEDCNLLEVFKKERWRSYSNFATLHGRSVNFKEVISFVAPIVVVLSFVLSVIAVFMSSGFLALAFAALALLPVLSFSFRLLHWANGRLKFASILSYYLTYFVARGIGMLSGLGGLLNFRGKLKETS